MPQRGRPPQPGTAEEKAAIRREKVRLYVKAHRERKKNSDTRTSTNESLSSSSPTSSGKDSGDESGPLIQSVNFANRFQPVSTRAQLEDEDDDVPPSQAVVKRTANNRAIKSSPFAMTPQGGKEFALALLGTFRGNFLPGSVKVPSREEYGSALVTPCSVWITHAYGLVLSQDSSALRSCMLACGLALTSMQYQDQRLRMASLDVYRKALRQVRNDLKPLTAGTGTSYLLPYMSCLAAAMFEIMHDGYSEKIMQHVKGAISLIRYVPQDTQVRILLGDLLLEDLCMWEIVFALKYRYPSPLRPMRRQKGPREYKVAGDAEATTRNATVLGDLLDCADEIPEIMSQIDSLRMEPHSGSKSRALQTQIIKLSNVLNDLDSYALRLSHRFGPAYKSSTATADPESPEASVEFVSYEIACAWIYYLAFHVAAVETNIECLTELLHVNAWTISKMPTYVDTTYTTNIVPQVAGHVEYAPGHRDFYSGTSSLDYAPPSTPAEDDFLQEKLIELRGKQRSLAAQLVQACCVFAPIPKGVVGAGLILFPMDRAKMAVKRELRRLNKDLANLKSKGVKDHTKITSLISELSQALATYDALELLISQEGMSPMVEDDD